MRLTVLLGGLASILLLTTPSAAQAPGAMPKEQSLTGVNMPWAAGPGPDHVAWPLIAIMLDQREELRLSPAQVERLERLIGDFARDAIRRQADLQITRLDLAVLLEPDPADPAKAIDLAKAETKLREIERISSDLELALLRTIEAGKAQLTEEQRSTLATLFAEDPADPADDPSPSRGAGHPPGGTGHPPGSGHPTAPRPPGHPSPGHEAHRPEHRPGFHRDIHGRFSPGISPWFWWGSPGYVYTPPQSYWYYCPSYGAYYPYVQSCPEPWILVPAG